MSPRVSIIKLCSCAFAFVATVSNASAQTRTDVPGPAGTPADARIREDVPDQASPPTSSAADHTTLNKSGDEIKNRSDMALSNDSANALTSQGFATRAATTDLAEIQLAQLAMTNSNDANVKQFAERMVKEHSATSAKLKTIAAKEGLALPTALDAEHAAVKTRLTSLKGKEFDQAYAQEMAKGHDKAVALFESATQAPLIKGDLKQFATSTLPKIRDHDSTAHKLHMSEGA
jgi:putative membrane protein